VIPVVRQQGSVARLHALDPFEAGAPEPAVWWCDPSDDAIVLGSRQPDALVDRDACDRAGISVVRRRSGGGAVLVRRAMVHWIDLVLPDGVAPDDIRGSMVWLGEHWHRVLQPDTDEQLRVHRGGLERTAWSELVCFSGVGPGEVVSAAGKLVGLSQRRTRHGIRVQCLVHDRPVGHEYRSVLAGQLPPGEPMPEATMQGLEAADLAARLAAQITGE